MTTPGLPENWEATSIEYAFGNLSASEAEAFNRLLASHPEIQIEVDQIQEVLALMPYSLSQQDPPPHLRAAILAAAQTEANARSATTAPVGSNRWKLWRSLGGAIAALLVMALTVDNYRLRQDLQDAESFRTVLQQPDTQVYALKGVGKTTAASGQLIWSSQQRVAIVAVQNLPQLPLGQVYRLWGLTAQGNVLYYGQFTARQTATTEKLTLSPDSSNWQVAELRVTQELSSDPPLPRGSAVLSSN